VRKNIDTTIKDKGRLDLDTVVTGVQVYSQGYIYFIIVTNQEDWSIRQITHCVTGGQKIVKKGLKNLNSIMLATHNLVQVWVLCVLIISLFRKI
jgi:hypothetical protein